MATRAASTLGSMGGGGDSNALHSNMGPSHVGVQGNERVDEGAVRGSVQAFREVLRNREVRNIWHELGLEEMVNATDDNMSGGVRSSDVSDSESAGSADLEFDSDTEAHRVLREGDELTCDST